MKKIIYSAICGVMFMFTNVAFSVSSNEALETRFNKQMDTAEKELRIALQYIAEQLDKDSNHLTAYDKNYCNIKYENCIDANGNQFDASTHSGMGTVLSQEYGDVVIQRIAGGWVGFPTGSSLAAVDDPGFDFIDMSNSVHSTVFNRHLCVEVHFKDSSEVNNDLPLYAGKTVVFCAKAPGGELIDIDMVDSDTSNGGDTSHKILSVDTLSWKCLNPHNDFCNNGADGCSANDTPGTSNQLGAGFGYDTKDDTPEAPLGLDNKIFGICIPSASPSLQQGDGSTT